MAPIRLLRCLSRVSNPRLALLFLLALPCAHAFAQNTTISGTVYDPRGTSGLPLPNVLVYASTGPVNPPAAGVQCLTVQTPTGPNIVSSTYTAVDGTFTLPNIPEGANYTIVIQAGKWQRQFSETVDDTPLTGLVLSMPANHTEGNIPMIAIATGSVDGAECVLRDMGISDSEFTDDTGSVNPGGYIHLYKGSSLPGAQISAATPSETLLMNGTSTTPLNSYDMVMFPCQGTSTGQATATGATNLLNFADAGGRIFATHYSYVWLDPAYGAEFGSVANWTTGAELSIPSGVGTVLTNFSDGATLAQWLENSGATISGSANQIDIGTLRTDVGSVISPTQSWVTLNNGTYSGGTVTDNPVMQMTFNVPVGAPATGQCGRVMYNDYHVIALNADGGTTYPAECPSYNNPSYKMSAQEEMLEYALFDLSSFVQPVVTPTVNVTFNPSPVLVKEGDTADQVTVNVTNTSSNTEIGSSLILSFTPLPQLWNVTAMSDATGGWVCNVATVTCTRNSSLAAGATDSVTLTFGVSAYPAGGLTSYTGVLTATTSSVTFSNNPSFTDNVIYQQPPAITWATPAPIVYGTPLSSTQLDASTTIAGSFTYNPSAGTVLPVGQQTLSALFTPTNTTNYTTENASVTLTVLPATPTVNLSASAGDVFLTNAVTFTATIPSQGVEPTGTVTFYDGGTAIGTATLSGGSASITSSSLPAGSLAITAVYSGDSTYAQASSSPLTETVQDFTLTAAGGGTASVLPAAQASFTLTLTPVGGSTFPGALSLSVKDLPVGVSATFNPAGVAASSPATNVVLEVQLSGSAALHRPASPLGKDALPLALGLILLPFSLRRRGRAGLRGLLLLAAMAVALGAGFTGCGGNLSNQSFSFPVTAQSGSLSHSVTVQLTVEAAQH